MRGTASFDLFRVKTGARLGCRQLEEPKKRKKAETIKGCAKSRMRRKEIPNPIWIKFAGGIAISEVIMYENFGDDRLRGFFGVAGVKFEGRPT